MAVSYNRLWKLLVDKNMSKSDLRKTVDMSPQTLTKMRRDEPITLTTLDRKCWVLNTESAILMSTFPMNMLRKARTSHAKVRFWG